MKILKTVPFLQFETSLCIYFVTIEAFWFKMCIHTNGQQAHKETCRTLRYQEFPGQNLNEVLHQIH